TAGYCRSNQHVLTERRQDSSVGGTNRDVTSKPGSTRQTGLGEDSRWNGISLVGGQYRQLRRGAKRYPYLPFKKESISELMSDLPWPCFAGALAGLAA